MADIPRVRIGPLPTEGSPMLITSEYVPSGGGEAKVSFLIACRALDS